MRPVPPLNPLHVFEVAARLGSFTQAAEELRVTQSAVSRQVATLEDFLGTALFERGHKGILLTSDGAEYFAEIGPAMAAIAAATDSLVARYKTNEVRVASYPTFAVKWLIPRLPRFRHLNQNIQVRLNTSIKPVNFDSQPFDVAIQLRREEDVDPEFSKFLYWDDMQPYCSPDFLSRHQLGQVADLLTVNRLHSHYRTDDWKDWLAANGLEQPEKSGDEYPSSLLTYKAAVEGHGVVIGQKQLMAEEEASGALVPIFSPVRRRLAYYVVWSRKANSKVRNFVRWVVGEVGPAVIDDSNRPNLYVP